MTCKYCKQNHEQRSRQDFDGKPFICMELHEAMLRMDQKQLREEVDHEFLRTWSVQCPHCGSYHYAWPPCSEELGTTRAPTSLPVPITSLPTPNLPGCLHIKISGGAKLEIHDGVNIRHKPALRAEVRDETGALLADCICQDERTAIDAATQAGIAVWKATRPGAL